VDETQRLENQDAERSDRFKKVARRIREQRIEEQKNAAPKTPAPGDSSVEAILEALRRKTQLQDPGSTPAITNLPPDLQGLFAPKGPSLLDAFGGGGNPQPALTNPDAASFFQPTFMSGVANTNTATGSASPLNPMFFATPETTAWLIQQKLPELGFPGAQAFLKNSGSNGGPFVANQQELWLRLPNGTEMNAGFLADYYVRNPEDKFPGLADKYVKQIIEGEIQAQAGKVNS
jgi:hypothetical protein